MNKTAIKNFAVWARNKLISDISYKAGLLGITEGGIAEPLPQSTGATQFFDIGSVEPFAIHGIQIRQRDKLVDLLKQKANESDYATAYKYIMEEVAYTWFNRLIAIRFMEVNDYLPSHVRVLSSETGKMEPDLVTNPFDAELEFRGQEESLVIQLQQDNKIDELFRMLFVKQCNALNEILPALFEKTDDYMELLLNLSVIDKEGVVYRLVNDIPEEDFDVEHGGQVEIIGWLYQYYNTEPKNEAFAKKSKITKDEIPAVTQLFTPDWIVRYMVENSLGRLWLDGHPDDVLKAQWKYYLDEAEQEPEVQVKLDEIRREHAKLNPEDIKLIDPCMGSGHILVYAFDVLMQIYESVGWSQRDAAKSILENNIYGLDIDDRAGQMAYFAIMMKARQYSRRIFSQEIEPHVYAIQESNGITSAPMHDMGINLSQKEYAKAAKEAMKLVEEFHDAKEYGSIIDVEEHDWELLKRFAVPRAEASGQMTLDVHGEQEAAKRLQKLIKIGINLAQKYEVVVTNPPYMGSDGMGDKLGSFIKKKYSEAKADIYAVFVKKCDKLLCNNGYQSMITQHSWMFLSSFDKLREDIVFNHTIYTMVHLGARGFDEISGEVVQTTAWVMQNGYNGYKATYSRLIEPTSEKGKEKQYLDHLNDYVISQKKLQVIPNNPVAYWLSEGMEYIFSKGEKITNYVQSRDGLTTGNNEQFIKCFWEPAFTQIGFGCKNAEEFWNTEKKYAPLVKGGPYRKWYGNISYVITYDRKGFEALSNSGNKLPSRDAYFKAYNSWNRISTRMAFRYSPKGFLFESASLVAFSEDEDEMIYALSFANSVLSNYEMQMINPTTNMLSGYVNQLCIPNIDIGLKHRVIELGRRCIEIAHIDWDSFETSWDFSKHPLIAFKTNSKCLIKDAFEEWKRISVERFKSVKSNEEEINSIFVSIYNLNKEINCMVDEKDITIRKADLQRDIKSLLSYAVGCMFGRYSLDNEGLIYAGGDWNSSKYSTFIPDMDGIIPITDEEYFEDDIVGLFCGWLKKVYGADNLEENLDFIAKALSKKGSSSREIIRNYFLTDFFKDHCSTYSVTGSGKRPIYWLFDSGKQNGFKALVYMHRWNADTIGNLRVDYLHRMQRTLESEINRMQDMIDNSINNREVSIATKRKEKLQKQIKECQEYDEKIGHLALSRIDIDLDDGVKVNYEKVQTAQDGKKYQVLMKI